jgi:hypothetical protein
MAYEHDMVVVLRSYMNLLAIVLFGSWGIIWKIELMEHCKKWPSEPISTVSKSA